MTTAKVPLFAPVFIVLACAAAWAEGPAAPADTKDDIDRLIRQLGSDDFEAREEASRKLADRDDALRKLRAAAKSEDAETRARAERLVEAISRRLGDKVVQELLKEVNKEGIDRFIDRMALEMDYATAERWQVAYKLAEAVAARASKLSGRQFDAPRLDLANMPTVSQCEGVGCEVSKVRLNGLKGGVTLLGGCLVVSAGPLQHITGVENSVVFVNGDMKWITGITNSIIFCNGDLGDVTGVDRSVVICTGEFEGSTTANDNVFDVHKMGGHTTSNDNVYINLKAVKATQQSGNQFIQTDDGPSGLFTLFDPATMGVELRAAEGGVRVASIRDGTPFAKVGFQKDDLVVGVDKAPDASVEAIRKYLRRRAAGDEAVFKVRRGDKIVELTVHFTE